MIFKSDMAISLLGEAFTDELYTDVGAAAFSLRDLPEDQGHDYFRGLIIRTASGGGGTLLEEGTDYTLSEENTDLSDRASTALGSTVIVYKKITVVNAIYQAGALYFSGYYHGDAVSSARLNKEKPRYYTADVNDTIDSTFGCGKIFCDAGANGIKLTLDFEKGQEVEFIKTDDYATNKSAVTLIAASAINGLTAQDGNYYLWLFECYQRIRLYFDGTQYHITGGWLDYSTGGLNTNDWTDRHLGDLVITYDTETAAFAIGEKITLASGVTGIIVSLTATVMIIKKATSTGNAVNNEAITGSWGGAALVNGSTKNNDSNIWHNLTCDYTIFDTDLYYYENATMDLSVARKIGWAQWDTNTASVVYGFALWGINTTSFYIQTASGGIVLMAANGGISILDNEDHSYSAQVKKYY